MVSKPNGLMKVSSGLVQTLIQDTTVRYTSYTDEETPDPECKLPAQEQQVP